MDAFQCTKIFNWPLLSNHILMHEKRYCNNVTRCFLNLWKWFEPYARFYFIFRSFIYIFLLTKTTSCEMYLRMLLFWWPVLLCVSMSCQEYNNTKFVKSKKGKAVITSIYWLTRIDMPANLIAVIMIKIILQAFKGQSFIIK